MIVAVKGIVPLVQYGPVKPGNGGDKNKPEQAAGECSGKERGDFYLGVITIHQKAQTAGPAGGNLPTIYSPKIAPMGASVAAIRRPAR